MYKITINFKDGKTEILVGVGKPLTKDNQIMVKTPEDKEIIRLLDNIIGFMVEDYQE